MRLVECVPNISEGRDKNIINAITAEIESVEGVKLLDVDPGWDTNRTVITFVGSPEAVLEAGFRMTRKAYELIDMTKHKGAHPRMGAVDVFPFVPVSGVTMDDCVELAHKLAKRVAEELNVPVYLYEYAATRPERRNLADIRAGEYEALPQKLKDPFWKPDYGPAKFVPRFGAMVIGARDFLIAYNINLNTKDKRKANAIAKRLRETGYYKKDEQGNRIHVPGKFKYCKAIGWYVDDYGIAQISMNLTNYKVTPIHLVFEAASQEALERGVRVTGSEIVGLVPKDALISAGKYFQTKQQGPRALPERDLIFLAIRSLGLNDVTEFDPDKKIIEYVIAEPKPLINSRVGDLLDEISRDSPAPGGGSVSALSAALSSALIAMVGNLSVKKKAYRVHYEELMKIAERAQELRYRFMELVERDTQAFNELMRAMRLPKTTEEEVKARQEAIQRAQLEAIRVPMEVLESAVELFELAEDMARLGNPNSLSDVGVACLQASAAAEGAYLNVLINLPGLEDGELKRELAERADNLIRQVRSRSAEVLRDITDRLLSTATT